MPTSFKRQAQEILNAVERELSDNGAKKQLGEPETRGKLDTLFGTLLGVAHNVNLADAALRVEQLVNDHPGAPPETLVRKLIKAKCRQTAAVGAVTSGAGLVPGIGTAAALVLGTAADIGATFKLQAELVLEVAHLHGYSLNEAEKDRLVWLITGLSAGSSALARKAGQQATLKLGEKFAEKSLVKALPIIGVIASSGTNVLSTYIIGLRADAYFRLGLDGLTDWDDSLRAITGVDERKIMRWLAEGSKTTGAALAGQAEKVSDFGRTAGASLAQSAAGAGQLGKTATRTYVKWLKGFWKAVFGLLSHMFGLLWPVVTMVPRKSAALFRRKGA
ncbi:MAG: hypothetical protein ACE5G8_11825 [Anaerolineae bacterium]